MKAIWVYIKEHNLQDPKNKRKICPDEKLGKILPARTDMLKMNQQLSKHVYTQGERSIFTSPADGIVHCHTQISWDLVVSGRLQSCRLVRQLCTEDEVCCRCLLAMPLAALADG